jgi:hypothetical protein
MTVGYRAVLTETEPKEWMVETATNFANAVDVAETLNVGEKAYVDKWTTPNMLRKSGQECYRV